MINLLKPKIPRTESLYKHGRAPVVLLMTTWPNEVARAIDAGLLFGSGVVFTRDQIEPSFEFHGVYGSI